MKTHFGSTEFEAETETGLCGTPAEFNQSEDWNFVDCKKCQKLRKQQEAEIKMNMEDSCRDMAGFMDFIESKEGQEKIRKALQEQGN